MHKCEIIARLGVKCVGNFEYTPTMNDLERSGFCRSRGLHIILIRYYTCLYAPYLTVCTSYCFANQPGVYDLPGPINDVMVTFREINSLMNCDNTLKRLQITMLHNWEERMRKKSKRVLLSNDKRRFE